MDRSGISHQNSLNFTKIHLNACRSADMLIMPERYEKELGVNTRSSVDVFGHF